MLDKRLASEVRPRLTQVLGQRLRSVWLYGSEARGQSASDSDIDLMVLLEGPIDLLRDIQSIVRALYPIQLQTARPIHVLPVNAESFEKGEYSLYRNVKREGIAL